MASRGGAKLPPVRKSLGQHFLNDRRILGRIVDALAPGQQETVIEIGPGRGTLTDLLVERAGRVVAVEYDRALAAFLRARYASQSKVRIVQADVLQTPLGALAEGDRFALVGNVPYYITTPIVFHALRRPRPERAVYLVQREVAERMAAGAGSREYGALSVNLQALTTVELLFRVPAGAFAPPPKVESAVVRITPKERPVVGADDEQPFRDLVQALFGLRRKQMRRALREIQPMTGDRADEVLASAGIEPEVRPEVLTPEQFAALLRRLRDD
ncbi:MAG TPA: 16S rRNA (adenine(1518)-N(6)/adenine(1519)-N(6))-dimethyltransferase RsmA [Gemmatimonadaceae bacterium]|nr:16S rRNA (adenine(1518)-N(6)/adenine(1519)-N(6))-dimethyltransferase RsmA [Gemmatimonadaceae bacterium]